MGRMQYIKKNEGLGPKDVWKVSSLPPKPTSLCAPSTRCLKALRGWERLKLLDVQLKGHVWKVKEHEKQIYIAMETLLRLGLQGKTCRSKKPNPNMSTLVIASCLVLQKHNKRILTHHFCRHWPCTGCNSKRMHERSFWRWLRTPKTNYVVHLPLGAGKL